MAYLHRALGWSTMCDCGIRDHSHLLFEPLVGGHVSINYIMLSSVYLETFYDCIRLY